VLGRQEDDEPRVLRRGPRGFLPVTRSRPLPVLAQYATDRPTGWTGAGLGLDVCQCGKGFQWVGAIRDPFTPEYQNCIIAIWNE
jgi:hypothetical protein